MSDHVIGVDVGTTSVRLAIIKLTGPDGSQLEVVASSKKPISLYQDGNRFEQSSDEIWSAICFCCREAIAKSNVMADSIKAIGFSATCSLVIVDPGSKSDRDIILWMDHRATKESADLTQSGSRVLQQFGNNCSPEFSLSKLLWLNNHQPERFKNVEAFMELPDWLVYKCLGGQESNTPRSICSLVCKWGYDAENHEHCEEIQTLIKNGANKESFGIDTSYPGSCCGQLGLIPGRELGVYGDQMIEGQNVLIGTSLIDAHAGALGMLVVANQYSHHDITSACYSLTGTSSCHMILTTDRKLVPGIWGPYKNVILKGHYLLEAGQSMTGKLIELCIENHPEGKAKLASGLGCNDIIEELNELLLNQEYKSKLHILPFHHGNRSPLANPRLKGGTYGMEAGHESSLLEYYAATVDALVYENRLIMESMDYKPPSIMVSGGLARNEYFMRTLATVMDCDVCWPYVGDNDFMVLGASILARHALVKNQPLTMNSIGDLKISDVNLRHYRQSPDLVGHHRRRYATFKAFVEFSLKVDGIYSS